MDNKESYGIVETITEDGEPEVSLINEDWMRDNYFLWPPPSNLRLPQRKFLKLIPEDDWIRIEDFKILKIGLKSIKEANDRLNVHCFYDNTLDKEAQDAELALKRKHPVQIVENHLDYNSLFDDLQMKIDKTSSPKSTVLAFNNVVALVCSLCGVSSLKKYMQCDRCNSEIFCIDCDEMYHRHRLRVDHIREEKSTFEERNKAGEILGTEATSLKLSMKQKMRPPPGNMDRKTAKVGKPQTVTSEDVASSKLSTNKKLSHEKIKRKTHFLNEKTLKVAKLQTVTSAKEDLKLPEPKHHILNDPKINKYNSANLRSPPPLIQLNSRSIVEIHKNHSAPTQADNKAYENETLPVQIAPNTQQSKIRYSAASLCFICGLEGNISCEACVSTIFCGHCDTMYHKNPLRQHHKREKRGTSNVKVYIPQKATFLEQKKLGLSTILQSPVTAGGTTSENVEGSSALKHPLLEDEGDSCEEAIVNEDMEDIVENRVENACSDEEDSRVSQVVNDHIGSQKRIQQKTMKCRIVKKSNPIHARSFNKQTLKMLKDIKVNQKRIIDMISSVKKQQHLLKLAVKECSGEIKNLKEYVGRKPKDPIVMLKDFKSPLFPIERVASVMLLDSACLNSAYRDQIAVRRRNLSATNEDDVKAATKRVMGAMFTFGLLKEYSWTGKSDLNSGGQQKQIFSELIGIHDVIKTAVLQNLPHSSKTDKDCIDAIKENLRRAPQNQARSASSTK